MIKLIRALVGDTEAQLSIATDNWLVPAEKRNRARALYWARRAARNAEPRASLLIAKIMSDPETPESEAQSWIYAAFLQAAESGDVSGQFSLGCCYEQGIGVEKDLKKAVHWYTRAAIGGDSEAELAVARLCAGQTVSSDAANSKLK